MAASREVIDQVIAAYQGATIANRQTPSRVGNVVEIPQDTADEVMVTADLHGNRLNFDRLWDIAELEDHPRRHLIMHEVCHGGPTYPLGNGCMSHRLLEDVAKRKTQFPDRFHFLLSNHEMAEMTDFPIVKYNQMLNVSFRCGLQETYGAGAESIRAEYVPFLRSCPLAVRVGDGVFVSHSAPERVDVESFDAEVFSRPLTPEDFVPGGPVFRLVWGRDFRHANASAFAKMVGAEILIHGHEPCPDGFLVPNEVQIILDCCGDSASYVIIPVGENWSQRQLVENIRQLS